MTPITRRSFVEMALVFGASAAWGNAFALPSRIEWRERLDLYPEGVASADPASDSVMLWTRHPPLTLDPTQKELDPTRKEKLEVEVAEDESFTQRHRHRRGADFRSLRLDLPRAGRRLEASARLLVPLHRSRRLRQPHRPDHHRARRR